MNFPRDNGKGCYFTPAKPFVAGYKCPSCDKQFKWTVTPTEQVKSKTGEIIKSFSVTET